MDALKLLIQAKNSNWKDCTVDMDAKEGKQGSIGFILKDGKRILAFKTSKYVDYLVEQEYCIGLGLSIMTCLSPHFTAPLEIESGFDSENPEDSALFLEYVPHWKSLSKLVLKLDNEPTIMSIALQVICSIYGAQLLCNFTHYDLHSQNVLVQHCDANIHYLFSFGENEHVLLPTFGYLPKIIDYGFSYCAPPGVHSVPFHSTLDHTHVGFTTPVFDPWNDIRLLLVTIADDFKYADYPIQLTNVIKNLFGSMPIQWDSGWERFSKVSANKHVNHKCKEHLTQNLTLFRKLYWVDILMGGLGKLPFKKHDTDQLDVALQSVETEFSLVENLTQDADTLEIIFKRIVDSVRELKKPFLGSNGSQRWALDEFRKDISSLIDEQLKFATIPDINWELLFGGILLLAQSVEGLVADFLEEYQEQRQHYYSQMKIKSVFECITMLQCVYDQPWILDNDSKIYHIDLIQRRNREFKVHPDHQSLIAKAPHYKRGQVLYDLVKEHFNV